MHIAHAAFWEDSNGNCPDPFTTITYQDILDRKWRPRASDEGTRGELLVSTMI